MLIAHVILVTGVVCCTASSVISIDTSASSATSTKLKRGIIDPGPDIRNNQEQFGGGTQSTPRNSPPQDINSRLLPHYRTAKASDTRKVPYSKPNQRTVSHAYGSVPKRPFSYTSVPARKQAELYQASPLAPYFNVLNNPSTYKVAANGERPLDASKSITSQSLQKLQTSVSPNYHTFLQDKSIEFPGFSDFEYPLFSAVAKITPQSLQKDASSPTVQMPVYKTVYPSSKVTKYANVYAPSFPVVSSDGSALLRATDKRKPNAKQNDEATIDVNGEKISLPIIQLQADPDLSAIAPVFDNQQFLLSANYPLESDFSFDFGDAPKFSAAPAPKNASPFLSPLSSFQGQVVPIQTANGNPQFPQYKGASIEVYSVPAGVPKVQGNYESLYNQPQLHFGKEHAGQLTDTQQNAVQSADSMEDILDDVEIINKKNPEPHPSQSDSDEVEEEEEKEERDERYKVSEKENEDSSENDDDDDDDERESGKYFKEPPSESDFKPSTSFPFKEYDEKFGKHAAQVDDEDSDDKSYFSYKNYPTLDDDEDEEEPSSAYVDSPKSQGSYEVDEEEEESRKYEKREKTKKDAYEVEPKHSNYYGKDFEEEFEESYREELPKHKYVHVKEVPDIDSNNNPKPPRRQSNNDGRARANRERSSESRNQESRVPRRNRKTPKRGYKDSVAHSSDISAKKASKVIYEEFFGYKKPVVGKYSERARAEMTPERYSPAKKSTGQNSYLRASKYHKSKNPKVTGGRIAKSKYSHSRPLSANNNRKLELRSKDSSEESVPRSSARQLSDPGDRASLYEPSVVNGQTRSLTNEEILRDLTGI